MNTNRRIGESENRGGWLIVLSVLCVLSILCPSPALAVKKTWLFTLITPGTGVSAYESGNTTATKQSNLSSGVSNMARRHGPFTDELKNDPYVIDISESNGVFMARIKDLDPSQAVSGASQPSWPSLGQNTSGTTFYIYVATAQGNDSGDWAVAEKVPVFLATAISGNTPMGRMLKFRPARYMKAWFLPSGVTPFDNAQLEVTTGFDEAVDVPVYVISEGSFTMPASGTGASQFTAGSIGAWPGGEYLEYQGGNSLFVTANGTAPTTTGTGETVIAATVQSLHGDEARAVQFKTISAQTVWYRILSRKP